MVVNRSAVRSVLLLLLVACALFVVLVTTGVVTSPFSRLHVRRVQLWLQKDSDLADDEGSCDCVWRIGCPKFAWQTNFTSPNFRCGYEPMSQGLVAECLATRRTWYGRDLRLYVAGYVREAFLVDYIRQRLAGGAERETCRLHQVAPRTKDFDKEPVDVCRVTPQDGGETCDMVYTSDGLRLEYKMVGLMGPDIFKYVEKLTNVCKTEGCEGDIFIFSGGVGELLNSTLLDSFTGVRRFQKHYRVLLPMLITLVTEHKMEVVMKIHEPVTDELIPESSMVRNDLLQEYNALIMEQTMSTPVTVWTSHMLMKLHHIELCEKRFTNTTTPNEPLWRCEEEWVAGDNCHDEYFDTIFNKACDKHVAMPTNPCCSA